MVAKFEQGFFVLQSPVYIFSVKNHLSEIKHRHFRIGRNRTQTELSVVVIRVNRIEGINSVQEMRFYKVRVPDLEMKKGKN